MSELERNTLAYLWRYGLFLKFSQSDEWFNNNIAISTFLRSTAVDPPSSYSDRYLKPIRFCFLHEEKIIQGFQINATFVYFSSTRQHTKYIL